MIASPGQLRASFLRWALVLVPLVLVLGLFSATLGNASSVWFQDLTKPATFPPPATFGIVWTLLYVLMGLAAALIAAARGAPGRSAALALFAVQLVINMAWSPVFFGQHQMHRALMVIGALDLAVACTLYLFWRVRPRAGMLLVPYLAWILFATLLNWQFIQANPDADGRPTSNAVTRIQLGP
ncbi:MAG: TspO/MBR family protein [Novosphingobium sp.]